jgi:soluble calcium-activated nucleotidase 1
LVADLDGNSNRYRFKRYEWNSFLKVGQILWDGEQFDVEWVNRLDLVSSIATNNRSMEFSELTWWNGAYLAVCDYTGIVWKVRPTTGEVFPRFVLADGDGKTTRTLKAEWMTVYDGQLFIGSHGKEWTKDGVILGRGAEWVKVIQPEGLIRSVHWIHEYDMMRRATGTEFPGYLTHEAAVFNHYSRQWVFLPRKASKEAYDDSADEHRGTNLLLLCSEDFANVTVLTVGPLEPEWGFSSVALVPGSNGKYLIATKVHEVGDDHRTKLTIFEGATGRIMLTPELFVEVEDIKYEGVEFLGEHENW